MWLGIDLGTGSVKVVLVDALGVTLRDGRASYPVTAPRPGYSETDPADWWHAVVSAVREAVGNEGSRVRGIGLSGQMHGVVLCSEDGTALRNAILWSDGRSTVDLAGYDALSEAAQARLANPIVVGHAGPTLSWIAREEPATLHAARWALQPKDWLRLRLTGEAASEPSDASGTLLYDVLEDTWDDEVIDTLGLDRNLFAPLVPSHTMAGRLISAAAGVLGLPAGTPVAAGAGDTPAAIFGSFLPDGVAQLTVGSGAQIVATTRTPISAAQHGIHLYRTAEPGSWYHMAAMQNAGLALEWVRALLGFTWDDMYDALQRSPAGADGLTFLPYLTGERTPLLTAAPLGGWSFASRSHGPAHFARAAFEGVAFSIRAGSVALSRVGTDVKELRLAGGGTLHPAWRQLLADALQATMVPITTTDASVMGAARLAASMLGEPWTTTDPPKVTEVRIEPNPTPDMLDAMARFDRLTEEQLALVRKE